ncbi:hypothetical protein AX15_001244 [Amanita polypyramis BW_CC]|nr:hypothetical protein AX15_001244 [Amanita polypyramis BW_CC]
MKILGSVLVLVVAACVCHAVNCTTGADLRNALSSAGINALYSGDPDYKGYSQAYNRRFTIDPAAITFPKSPDEVSKIVKIGADCRRSVVARSGGHSYIANGLGGTNGSLVIDLRILTSISVNNSSMVTVQTGNRLGGVAVELNNHGLALPHGTCPYVGVGGHSAYGGWGFTSRMWGFNVDAIQSMDVVLANGTRTIISADKNNDLFRAMRGAGPSFGIATSVTYNAKPIPSSTSIFQYQWNMNPSDAVKAVSEFQKYVQTNISEKLGSQLLFSKGKMLGELSFGLRVAWYGPADQFDAVIKPYLDKVRPFDSKTCFVGSYIGSVEYLGGLGTLNISAPDSTDTFYAKSLITPNTSLISDQAFNAFTKYTANEGFQTTLDWFAEMDLFGGTNSFVNTVPENATALANRNALWNFQLYASSSNHKPPYPGDGFSFLDNMVKSITSNSINSTSFGSFPNYPDLNLTDWQHRYYGSNYEFLKDLKKKYDPNGVFTFPLTIGQNVMSLFVD